MARDEKWRNSIRCIILWGEIRCFWWPLERGFYGGVNGEEGNKRSRGTVIGVYGIRYGPEHDAATPAGRRRRDPQDQGGEERLQHQELGGCGGHPIEQRG